MTPRAATERTRALPKGLEETGVRRVKGGDRAGEGPLAQDAAGQRYECDAALGRRDPLGHGGCSGGQEFLDPGQPLTTF